MSPEPEQMPVTPHPADLGGGTAAALSALSTDVFQTLAARFIDRAPAIAVFTEFDRDFESWCVWEAVAALGRRRPHRGWSILPEPRYADLGVTGSRENADVLVNDHAHGHQVVVELALIQDWSRNNWIDILDSAAARLARPFLPEVEPLQVVLAASPDGPIDVNPAWQRWLRMAKVWQRPADLTRTIDLAGRGQLAVFGWAGG